MSTIEIISASAGSGKTYRLAALLEEEVTSERVRPEAVLATTFTNKAAAELQERVRVRLLEAGRVPDAQRLTAAQIGTVNSICGRLVSDFAFELGLSPQLQVLDEELAAAALRKSLASVLTSKDESELASLSEHMTDFDWQNVVQRIVDLARSNGIAASQLKDCARRSKSSFLELLGKPANNAASLNTALVSTLEGFVKAVRGGTDQTQKTKAAVNLADNALRRLGPGFDLAWKEWAGLAKLDVGAGSREAAQAVCVAAAMQDQHPQLHQDVSQAIELVFSVAAQAMDA
jgi:superfamily I DNA/RNA helicase